MPKIADSLNPLINPPPLRYRKPRPRRSGPELKDGECSLQYFTPLGRPRPQTTFGVPAEWSRFLDMLLWSFRGNAAAVQAQIQERYQFSPPLSVQWARLRLKDTAFQQLQYLQKFLPGEAGTINRVKIRATVLNGGHDFFHEGPTEDDTPKPGSPGYIQAPLPPGGPEKWRRDWDVILCQAVLDGESPADVLRLLRKTQLSDLQGLTRSWLELRMAQSGH